MAETRKLPGSILVLCTHNVIRSRIAEALLQKRFGDRIFTDSAGIRTGTVDPFVTAVLDEQNIASGDYEPKSLEDLEDTWFDLVIAFSNEAFEQVQSTRFLEYGEMLYWPAGDPTEAQGSRAQRLDAYRAVRDAIARQIDEYFPEQAP